MPTILFATPAGVFDFNQIDPETGESGLFVENENALRSLDGIEYKDEIFSDYLFDGTDMQALQGIGIQGGVLTFAFDANTKQLIACTEYFVPRHLSAKEVDLLRTYTIGQWSDGIGSNFFQERMSEGLAPQVFVTSSEAVHVEQRA